MEFVKKLSEGGAIPADELSEGSGFGLLNGLPGDAYLLGDLLLGKGLTGGGPSEHVAEAGVSRELLNLRRPRHLPSRLN